MKLAIYHNLPSGGGKRALYEMTRRLAAHHEVDVYTLSSAEHDFCDLRPYCRQHIIYPFKPLPLARCPFGRLNQGIRTLDLLRLRALQQRIADRIAAERYDVVFMHHCRYGQSPALLQFLTAPSVYYCAEPPRALSEPPIPRPYAQFTHAQRFGNLFDPLPELYRKVLADFDRKNVRGATKVLVNSAYSRESLYRTYGIFANVCYLGVDAERFRPLGLPKQDFVLSVGALDPHKGFDFLIHSLALLSHPSRPPLVIASNYTDSDERDYLTRLAAEMGVAVDFRSQISDAELVRAYNQARLTLYAPVMEPFGFVPLEAMACGTPVIGVREAGVRESVADGATGLLVDRDPAEFARAMEALLTDPDRATDMGRHGRDHVLTHWTWERTLARLEGYLAEAAGGNR